MYAAAASCPLRLLLSATSCRRGAQRWGRPRARCGCCYRRHRVAVEQRVGGGILTAAAFSYRRHRVAVEPGVGGGILPAAAFAYRRHRVAVESSVGRGILPAAASARRVPPRWVSPRTGEVRGSANARGALGVSSPRRRDFCRPRAGDAPMLDAIQAACFREHRGRVPFGPRPA